MMMMMSSRDSSARLRRAIIDCGRSSTSNYLSSHHFTPNSSPAAGFSVTGHNVVPPYAVASPSPSSPYSVAGEYNLSLIKRLASKVDDIRNPGPGRKTSLTLAVEAGAELELIEWLLDMGHEVGEPTRDSDLNTVLHTAAFHLRADVVSVYYERCPNLPDLLNWANAEGRTALHIAAHRGGDEVIRLLCDLGADVDLPDLEGNTPLHYASAWGHLTAIQLLIERGCSYAFKNNEGFTAADFAFSHSVKAALEAFGRAQYDQRRRARRAAAAAPAGLDRSTTPLPPLPPLPHEGSESGGSVLSNGTADGYRLRSGSGGSRGLDELAERQAQRREREREVGHAGLDGAGRGDPGMPPPFQVPHLPNLTPAVSTSTIASTSTSLSVPPSHSSSSFTSIAGSPLHGGHGRSPPLPPLPTTPRTPGGASTAASSPSLRSTRPDHLDMERAVACGPGGGELSSPMMRGVASKMRLRDQTAMEQFQASLAASPSAAVAAMRSGVAQQAATSPDGSYVLVNAGSALNPHNSSPRLSPPSIGGGGGGTLSGLSAPPPPPPPPMPPSSSTRSGPALATAYTRKISGPDAPNMGQHEHPTPWEHQAEPPPPPTPPKAFATPSLGPLPGQQPPPSASVGSAVTVLSSTSVAGRFVAGNIRGRSGSG